MSQVEKIKKEAVAARQESMRGCGRCVYYWPHAFSKPACTLIGGHDSCAIREKYCKGDFFEEKPPKPPSFWKRLGDAIIERVRGNQ